MEGIKVTLLGKDEVSGENPNRLIYFLRGQTDLVPITHGYVHDFDGVIEPMSSYTMLKDCKTDSRVYNYKPLRCYDDQIIDRTMTLRPVLELSPEMFKLITKDAFTEGVMTDIKSYVYFGHYPQIAPKNLLLKKLLKKHSNNNRRSSELPYNPQKDLSPCNDNLYHFGGINDSHGQVYEYKDKKYAYLHADLSITDYSDLRFSELNKFKFRGFDDVLLEILPIKWLIDFENQRLISDRELVSGIPYSKSSKCDMVFEHSNVYDYLNNVMLNDMLQFTKLEVPKKEDEKTNSPATPLFEEIKQYKRYYLGEEDITAKVKKLTDDYNKKLLSLSGNPKMHDLELKIGYKDVDDYHRDYIVDLNEIIDSLKSDYEIVKDYVSLLDILSGNNTEDEMSIFLTSVKTAIATAELLMGDKCSFSDEFNSIINNSIQRINGYIDECKLNKKNTPNKTLDELKLEVRRDLQPFLERLNETVIKVDLVKEIIEGTKAIIDEQYIVTKNSMANKLLSIIKETVKTIKTKGTKADFRRLKSVANFEVDYSKDLVSILKDLNGVIKRIYRIELDILARKAYVKKCNNLMVNVDVESYLDGEESTLNL